MHVAGKIITGLLIILFLVGIYYVDSLLRRRIQPKSSLQRLLVYILLMFVTMLVVTALMVLLIHTLFPAERMR